MFPTCWLVLVLLGTATSEAPSEVPQHLHGRSLSHCVYNGLCGYCAECPMCSGTCGSCCAPRPLPPHPAPAPPCPPSLPSPPFSPPLSPSPPSPPTPPSAPPPPPYFCNASSLCGGGSQWAVDAEASSAWGDDKKDLSAWQSTNSTNVAPKCGQYPEAWQPSKRGRQWLKVTFAAAVWATSIEIFETLTARQHCSPPPPRARRMPPCLPPYHCHPCHP